MKTDDFAKTLKQIRQHADDIKAKVPIEVPIDVLNKIATDIMALENNNDFRKYAMFVGELSIENPACLFVDNAKSGLYDDFSDKTYCDLMNEINDITKLWWKDQPDLTLDIDKTYTELMINLEKAEYCIVEILEFFTALNDVKSCTNKANIQ